MSETRTPSQDLREQVRTRIAGCDAGQDALSIDLELTLAEIVDVRLTLTPGPATTPAQLPRRRACVEEALWELTPQLDNVVPHQIAHVVL